jgi:hypothetical protein
MTQGEHTHVTITNDVSFLCARELVARPGETLDELLLQNTSVAKALTRQMVRHTVAIDRANCASFDIGPLSPLNTW